MALTVTSFRRRLAMAVLLGLAASGGVIRYLADNPSTLRDIGTLLLVMWIPAVGNLVGYLAGKIPRRAPPPTGFLPGSPFAAQLRAQLTPVAWPDGFVATLDPQEERCTVLAGRHGFTARTGQPLAQWLPALAAAQPASLEFLRPAVALKALMPGTPVHVLVGTVAVAKGLVL